MPSRNAVTTSSHVEWMKVGALKANPWACLRNGQTTHVTSLLAMLLTVRMSGSDVKKLESMATKNFFPHLRKTGTFSES